MAETRVNVKNIIITILLFIVLIFFCVIAVFQIYEEMAEPKNEEPIVLGVGNGTQSSFGSRIKGQMVPVGDYVGIVSGGQFMIVDENAGLKSEGSFMLSDPIVHSRGRYVVAADYKGKTARLYKEGELECEIKSDGRIISVVTNTNGFFAVAAEETGYNAVISVYRKNGEAIYRYRISENTFVDMDLSANNRRLIVCEANLSGNGAGSNVVLAEFNRDSAQREIFVENNLYYGVHFNKNGSFICLGNKGMDFYRADSALLKQISFEETGIKYADISSDDMITLAFDSSKGDGMDGNRVEIYDKNANLRGTAVFENEIEHISVNGGYVGVAHGEEFSVVRPNGKIKKSFEVSSPIKSAMAFKSGNAALIFAGGNAAIIR